MIRRLLYALVWLCLALPAIAQEVPDYELWERVATRAETAVETARASDQVFEGLREEVEGYRSEFNAAQAINSTRLATLRGQLEALGPVPEEGQGEAPEITERRQELNDQINVLAAPGLTAVEAFRRADGIIREIDALLRERRAAALLTRGPTLFIHTIWADAAEEVGRSVALLTDSVRRAFANGTARRALSENLPVIVALLAIALVFILRSRRWLEILSLRIEGGVTGAGHRVSGFIISLGQIIVPMAGILALTRALLLTGLFDFHGEPYIALLPAFGLAFFLSRWIAGRLFPESESLRSPLNVPRELYRGARYVILVTGVFLVVFGFVDAVADLDTYTLSARVAVETPIFIVLGILLYRLGRVLSKHEGHVDAEGEPQPSVLDRMVALLWRLSIAVGILGPLASILGYVNLASAMLIPTLHTLSLFAIMALVTDFVSDLYTALRRDKSSEEGLLPVFVASVLFIASIPILALIWGATVTDLGELWVRVQAGITIGETTISPGTVFVLLIVFLIGFLLTRFVQSALRSSVLPKTRLDIGGQTALLSGLGYIGIFLAGLLALSAAGIDLTSLAFIAGTLGVGIGFGLQNIVSNFISGIILLVERPISEGDWIEVGGNMGYVRDISVRSTRIETFDRTDVIVPNADLISGTVTNYTRGNSVGRVIVPVGVAYGTDTRLVEGILREIAEAHPMVVLKPPPAVIFQGFGESSLDFEIRAILRDVNWVLSVKSDLNHAIAQRFTEEDIEIPFAQRDLWLRNPEVLSAPAEATPPADTHTSDPAPKTAKEA